MRLAFLLLTLAALVHQAHAQTSATVLVEDSTSYGSANFLMSTSFVGLKLPSGGGFVYVTITPGDFADNSYVTSYADHTQEGPYVVTGPSTSFSIGTPGHYWMYLSAYGSNYNYDWLEIRVEASTFSGTVTCTYCAPPTGWETGWPPLGTHQETGIVPVQSQPGLTSKYYQIPKWVIPVLAVVIAVAVLVPVSYCVYRRRQAKKAINTAGEGETTTAESPSQSQTVVEMPTTVSTAV